MGGRQPGCPCPQEGDPTMKSRDGFEVVNALMREEANRRQVLKALGWSAAGLAGLGSLARPSLARAQKPKSGGTIKIGSFSNIDTLDAHNTTSIVACSIHNNIYNGLLKIVSSDGKSVDFKPELAREWEIQGDRVHRSEERRVGKECRSGGWAKTRKKKSK